MANNTLLASDSFLSGSLAAGWAAVTGLSTCQVVVGSPNTAQPNAFNTPAGQIWTGLVWPSNQTSEMTLGPGFNLNTNATIAVLYVRLSSSAVTGYQLNITATTATIYRQASGTATQIAQATGLTIAANDIWSFTAAGSALLVYQNYNLVLRIGDATYTSGSPGFTLDSISGSLANAQVSSWRGYSAVQQDGIWTKQGVVLNPTTSDLGASGFQGTFNNNILYETGAKILSPNPDGNIFKTWFGGGDNTYYAESSDGKTWTRQAGAIITGLTLPFLIKVSGTYYLYVQSGPSFGTGNFALYSATDGVTFTLVNNNVFSLGGVGQWDHVAIYNFCPITVSGGTWYAVYAGTNNITTAIFSLGLATSTDGQTWTRYGSNPILAGAVGGSVVPSPAVVKLGSVWYMWMEGNSPAQGGTSAGIDPTDCVRYQTSDFIHWVNPVQSVHHSQIYEGVNGKGGQCYANAIIDVSGKAYLYMTSAVNDTSFPQLYQVSLAIGPAATSSIVAQNEDAVKQRVSDGFTSGIGSLPATWTTPTGDSPAQIVAGNKVEPTIVGTAGVEVYTAISFNADQYSEITLATASQDLAIVVPMVRASTVAKTRYQANVTGKTGVLGSVAIFVTVAGASTQLGPTVALTPQVGDVFRLAVIGNTLSLYQNGFIILQVQDVNNTLTSGNPGFQVDNTTAIASTQISAWAGGNAGVIPSYGVSDSLMLMGVGT